MSKHRGGGKFGRVKNSWPFVTLTIESDSILMSTILQEALMKRESIQEIVLSRYGLNYRFIFRHNDLSIKKEIEFWTFRPDAVKEALKLYGYLVSENR